MSEDKFVTIPLPSGGKTYDDIGSEIKIRPFVGKDEALIAELNTANVKKKFITIVSNVIKDVDPTKLTSGDAKYIMLWEAINSYDRNYPISLVCENCTKNIDVVCDLGKINSKELPEDYKQPIDVTLSDRIIKLRVLTMGDEVSAVDWIAAGKSTYLYMYALSWVDDKLDLPAKLAVLEEMSTNDINEIRKFHEKYMHGPDMISTYKCPLCGYEGKIELPFQYDVLFSFSE